MLATQRRLIVPFYNGMRCFKFWEQHSNQECVRKKSQLKAPRNNTAFFKRGR